MRDASKPYIRKPVLVFLGLLGVGMLAVDWANGSARSVGESLSRAAILGAVYGMFVAFSDVAVGVDGTSFLVRNPLLVTRVPMALVESVDTQFGVYLKIRGRPLAVRVAAATSLFRLRRPAAGGLVAQLQEYVDSAAETTKDSVRSRVKWTWFAAVPLGVGLFLLVDAISRVAH